MKKKTKKYAVIGGAIIALVLLSVVGYMLFAGEKIKPLIGIEGYYDKDGNLIKQGKQQAIVGGVEGVYYIKLAVNAYNNDTTPLTFAVTSSSPSAFTTALGAITPQTVQPNQYGNWTSGLIDITPFEGQSVDFSVVIQGTSSIRQTSTLTGTLSLTVQEDPFANFIVQVSQV